MQLVIINGGIVSTCRGCDRQTRHPHIQLTSQKAGGTKLLCADFTTGLDAFPLFFFLGSDTAHYIQVRILLIKHFFFFPFGTCFHLRLERDRVTSLTAEWNFQGPRLQPNTWTHGHMEWGKRWMNEIHIFRSPCEAHRQTSDCEGYVPPWTLQH